MGVCDMQLAFTMRGVIALYKCVHLDVLLSLKAKGKLKLGYGEAGGRETVKLSNTQGQTISIVLEES